MPKYAEFQAFREQNFITEADGDMLHCEARALDLIFDRPETIHELVTDADLSKILKDLKPHLKNMLYYLFLHDYSATEYAESIGQSDRNIRGIRETALKKIRKLYGGILAYRKENTLPMTADFITYESVNAPQAVAMELQKGYAERYDWLVKEFTDLAFTFMTSFLYYLDYDSIDEDTRSLYRQGISAFGGIAPTYRITLEKDSPVIVWDFHSLLVMVQMCFSFMLTDKDSDMRLCKHCKKAFIASRKGNEFCSQKCKNQFNVYKSREKKKGNKRDD